MGPIWVDDMPPDRSRRKKEVRVPSSGSTGDSARKKTSSTQKKKEEQKKPASDKPSKNFYKGAHVKVSGGEAEKYTAVLESLGYSTKLTEFTVDSRGDSPELREELGDNYLDNRVILVSEDQLNKISLLPGTPSYTPAIISKVSKDLVKAITPHEALIGKINLFYGDQPTFGLFDKEFDYPFSGEGFCTALSLDTLMEAVRKINALNTKINLVSGETLKKNDEPFLQKFLGEILKEIHPLNTQYGSIKSIKNIENTVSARLEEDIFHFNHKGYELLLFNGNKGELLVLYKGDGKIESSTHFEVFPYSKKSEITNSLFENGFLKVEKEKIFDNLEHIVRSVLEGEKNDCSKLKGFQFYKQFKQQKDKKTVVEKLGKENWFLLNDFVYGKTEFKSLPFEIKRALIKPRDETVSHYLKDVLKIEYMV